MQSLFWSLGCETSLEFALLEERDDFFSIWDVFGEEVIEIIALKCVVDTARITEAGEEDEIEQESPDATFLLWGRWWWGDSR